jgi:UDP-N-acetylmuramate dehydrogenase
MNIQENYFLKQLTSFHIGGPARFFVSAGTMDELTEALRFATDNRLPLLLVGGGSNMVINDNGFEGLVVQMELKGKQLVEETQEEVLFRVFSGENWDDVVDYAVSKNWWGIENLSSIPGKSGAIPVQNVGAYGEEASQVVESVEVLDIATGEIKKYSNAECQFAYRKSIFNTGSKGRQIILSITMRLKKNGQPNISYPDLQKFFMAAGEANPSLLAVRNAVIQIRRQKFPKDDGRIGSAGSFFKNLILTESEYENLEKHVAQNFSPEQTEKLKDYKNRLVTPQGIKIPTAFIIDACGLKGESFGPAKISEKQPLVIINTGGAKASDVLGLFNKVKKIVYDKTGVRLQPEPELIGFTEKELSEYLS